MSQLRRALGLLALGCFAGPASAEPPALPSPSAGSLGVVRELGLRPEEPLGELGAYQGDLDLIALGALADWAPPGAAFRVAAGARASESEGVQADPFASVVTVGLAGDLTPAFTLGLELGVMDEEPSELEVHANELWPVAQVLLVYRF